MRGAGRIAALILADTARFTVPGLVAGVVLMAVGSQYVASQLFGVPATDVLTYVAGVAGIAGAAFLASLVPMVRTRRLEPTTVLRQEGWSPSPAKAALPAHHATGGADRRPRS